MIEMTVYESQNRMYTEKNKHAYLYKEKKLRHKCTNYYIGGKAQGDSNMSPQAALERVVSVGGLFLPITF